MNDRRRQAPEDGQEVCPICRAVNEPGALSTCDHFLGTVWEGELIASEYDAPFRAAWNALIDVYLREAERHPHAAPLLLRGTLAWAPLRVRPVVEAGVLLADPFFWVDDVRQLRVETGGMPGGVGFSLYHEDPAFMPKLVERMRAARKWVRTVLRDGVARPTWRVN
ncbi:hypothetical protein K8I85_06700 [bacterium]|nr:hypothetical protein [bacterium]